MQQRTTIHSHLLKRITQSVDFDPYVAAINRDLVAILLSLQGEHPLFPAIGSNLSLFANPGAAGFNTEYFRFIMLKQINKIIGDRISDPTLTITFNDSEFKIKCGYTYQNQVITLLINNNDGVLTIN